MNIAWRRVMETDTSQVVGASASRRTTKRLRPAYLLVGVFVVENGGFANLTAIDPSYTVRSIQIALYTAWNGTANVATFKSSRPDRTPSHSTDETKDLGRKMRTTQSQRV